MLQKKESPGLLHGCSKVWAYSGKQVESKCRAWDSGGMDDALEMKQSWVAEYMEQVAD